jgi:hypothetical protein
MADKEETKAMVDDEVADVAAMLDLSKKKKKSVKKEGDGGSSTKRSKANMSKYQAMLADLDASQESEAPFDSKAENTYVKSCWRGL